MASDGIAYRMFIQNEQLEQVDIRLLRSRTLGPWSYRRRWVYDGILHQVKQRAGDRGITAENMEKSQIPISTKIRLMKAIATYTIWMWKLDTQKEWRNTCWRVDAFERKGVRKILQVSWTAKKTNGWVPNKAGVKREPLDTVKARKLA